MTPPDPERLAWYEMNDLGNAERLKARSGGLLLYVREKGWIAYDGKRWSYDDGARRANQLAHDVARAIRDEVKALGEQIRAGRLPKSMVEAMGEEAAAEAAKEKLASLHKWAIKSGNAAQTKGMLTQAADEMAVPADSFDTDAYALNCQNCTLRFLRGPDGWRVEARPHDPLDRITRLADMTYVPGEECPRWAGRFAMIQPDEDQRRQLQVLMGYCLLGLVSDQQFYLNQGPGGDGKTMSWGTFAKLLGDYHRRAKVQTFLATGQRSGADHSSDIARLSGDIRLVTCAEPPKRSTFNSNLIKEVTGADKVTARALREAEIEFLPRWKLVMECNGLPRVDTGDDGWWRRVRMIPWPFQFKSRGVQTEQPHVLQAALLAEGSGILNWAIIGALEWLEHGGVPESRTSARALAEYRRSTDPFDEWYMDWCVTNDRDVSTRASDLYASFKEFSDLRGTEKIMSSTSFGLKLAEKQHEKHKSNGNIFRLGIRLRTDAERAAMERTQEAEDRAAGIRVVSDVAQPSTANDDRYGAGIGDDFGRGDDLPEGW
jgi:putative DNA primase/helicase